MIFFEFYPTGLFMRQSIRLISGMRVQTIRSTSRLQDFRVEQESKNEWMKTAKPVKDIVVVDDDCGWERRH